MLYATQECFLFKIFGLIREEIMTALMVGFILLINIVAGFNHSSNNYRLFSSIKKEGYAIHLRKEFGTYSFVGVDGCPKYGTRR